MPHPLHLDERVWLVVDVVASVIFVSDGVNILSGETMKKDQVAIRKFLDEVNSMFPIFDFCVLINRAVGPSTVHESITRD